MAIESDADRYADVKLTLACPKCGSQGLIPLDGLDRMLYCYGCQGRFGVEPQGLVELSDNRVHVHVRSHLSDWQGHHAVLNGGSRLFGHWLLDRLIGFLIQGRARWAALAGAILLTTLGIVVGNQAPAEKPPLVIPDSLPGRAELFSQALVQRDMDILTRLTDPSQHRALRIWLAHGFGIPAPVTGELADVKAEIVSNVTSTAGDRADLRVQISTAEGKPAVLDQQWAQRVTGWYFQPVRLRMQGAPKGSVKAYSKQRR